MQKIRQYVTIYFEQRFDIQYLKIISSKIRILSPLYSIKLINHNLFNFLLELIFIY